MADTAFVGGKFVFRNVVDVFVDVAFLMAFITAAINEWPRCGDNAPVLKSFLLSNGLSDSGLPSPLLPVSV